MYNTHLYHSFVDGQCSLQRVGWQLQSSPTPTPPLLGKFLAKGEAWTSIFEHRPHGLAVFFLWLALTVLPCPGFARRHPSTQSFTREHVLVDHVGDTIFGASCKPA